MAPKNKPGNKTEKWWKDGVRFECQSSGKCCTSRGEFGYVYLTPEDRERMAKVLGLSVEVFTANNCEKSGGIWHLKEIPERPDCMFLENKNRCGVYEGRPTQCRTWPFWPEVMTAKAWSKEVAAYCPGVGKGRLISAEEIEQTLKNQKDSEEMYGR